MNEAQRLAEFSSIMNPVGISVEFTNWLIENGFFTAPASSKYHGAVEGGLYEHSKMVTQALLDMSLKLGIKWERQESPIIIGMFHDLCKIDQYKKIIDKPGVEMMGKDEPEGEIFHYEYNKSTLLKGHGEKSIMLLCRWMELTEEEILCIRYHMGAYQTDDWNEYDLAIKKYATVLYTHTADMIASKVLGV